MDNATFIVAYSQWPSRPNEFEEEEKKKSLVRDTSLFTFICNKLKTCLERSAYDEINVSNHLEFVLLFIIYVSF